LVNFSIFTITLLVHPVEIDLFIEVLKHYSESSEEEALEVLSLKESFPYSQLLHALSARVSKDHGFVDHQLELQLAAVYAADRAVLKNVMTLDALVAVRPGQSAKRVSKSIQPAVQASAVSPTTQPPDSGSLADQVMNDLEKLHQLKHNFEMMFVDSGSAEIKSSKDRPKVEDTIVQREEAKQPKETAKSKRKRIIELARALDASKESIAVDAAPKVNKKKGNPGENIIAEIVSTKQEIEPENEKQKEQLKIIEQFIKTQPSISNPKDKPIAVPEGDLATIKTGEFSDNIVSETLVEILVKQGKKDKAIEVLKKLIWKFPQKKAYFAAQIEELKK